MDETKRNLLWLKLRIRMRTDEDFRSDWDGMLRTAVDKVTAEIIYQDSQGRTCAELDGIALPCPAGWDIYQVSEVFGWRLHVEAQRRLDAMHARGLV